MAGIQLEIIAFCNKDFVFTKDEEGWTRQFTRFVTWRAGAREVV